MKTAVQGQIEHLAWRPGDDAKETSGGPIQIWYFFSYSLLASSPMVPETREYTTLSLHLIFALPLSLSHSSSVLTFLLFLHDTEAPVAEVLRI